MPAPKGDDQLLEERIEQNRLNYPKTSLILVAAIVSFQPVYYAHAINGLDWYAPTNALLFVGVAAFCTYMLFQSYVVMVESEFWSRQRHFSEVNEKDLRPLRRLRLQVAIGYSLFLLNTVFFAVCTFLMAYIFRHSDPRANFILSPLFTSSILWFISQKNEESRQRRMKVHK